MGEQSNRETPHVDRFFAGPGARADQWYHLVELAEAWSRGSADRATFEAALTEMTATEEFHAYPGLKLMTALRDACRGQRCARDRNPCPPHHPRSSHAIVSPERRRLGRA